jgi:hypothetical protein
VPVTIVRAQPGDVAPAWHGDAAARGTYLDALRTAQADGLTTVTLRLPSGWHSTQALQVATEAVREADPDLDVRLVVSDLGAFGARRAMQRLTQHLAQALSQAPLGAAPPPRVPRPRIPASATPERARAAPSWSSAEPDGGVPSRSLAAALENLDEPFAATLLRLVDAKQLTDVEVYRRANLDRRLFATIRSDPRYQPSKRTALALAVGLELDLDETRALLARAGYTLSSALTSDTIVEYFIARGTHDVLAINEALFYFDQPLLGT